MEQPAVQSKGRGEPWTAVLLQKASVLGGRSNSLEHRRWTDPGCKGSSWNLL